MLTVPAGYYIHYFKQIDGGQRLEKYVCRADDSGTRCIMEVSKKTYNFIN